MSSLHEFTLISQAQEYLVALLAMVLFIPFWRCLNGRKSSASLPSKEGG